MVDQVLIQYIKTEEAQGFSEERLRKVLLTRGYAPDRVEAAIEHARENNFHPALKKEPEKETTTEKPKRTTHRPLGVILVAIIFWGVALAGLLTGVGFLINGRRLAVIAASSGFDTAPSLLALTGLIPIIIGVLLFWLGYSLIELREWARGSAMTLSIISMFAIIPIPLAALMLWALASEKTKKAFKEAMEE